MSKHVSNIPSGLQHSSSRSSPDTDIVVGSRVSVAGRKGVVKSIGKTQFADGEWFGVCLDNAKGKNDGSVNGVRYFESNADHGLFVKRAQVRLEGGSTAISAAPSRRAPIGIAQTRMPNPSSTSSSTGNKEEEEKKVEDDASLPLPPPSVSHTTSSIVSIHHAVSNENEIQGLFESKTSATAAANISFDSTVGEGGGNFQGVLKGTASGAVHPPHGGAESRTLTFVEEKSLAKKEAAETVLQIDEEHSTSQLRGAVHTVNQPEKTTTATDVPDIATTHTLISKAGSHHNILIRNLSDGLCDDEVMKEALDDEQKGFVDKIKIRSTKDQTVTTTQLEEPPKRNAAAENLKNELEGLVDELKQQLKEANKAQICLEGQFQTTLEEKSRENATNLAKEKAAAVESSARQIENLETQLSESLSTFEALTLEKEELELENETLAEEIDQLKEELAGCQLELDHGRRSAEETAAAAEHHQQPQHSRSENMVEVNEKLREALKRLHQISTHDKSELTELKRDFLKEKEIRIALEEELVELQSWKQEKEVELVALTEQVDQGTALQAMVESLSDKCMSFEGLNEELHTQVSDLVCSLELSEEIEERQAEELRAMRKELQSAEVAQLQRRMELEALQTELENERRSFDRFKVAAEELRCGMSELQLKLENKANEQIALKQRIKLLLADKYILANEAEVSRRNTLLVAMSNLQTAEARALSSRLRTLLPRGMTVLEVEEIELSSEILAARVAGKCLIACGMVQRLILSWLKSQFEGGGNEEEDGVYNEDKFLQMHLEAGVMNLLMRVRHMALKSLLENVNSGGGCFNERGTDSDLDCAVETQSINTNDMKRCDLHLDEILSLIEKEGGLFIPDAFNIPLKSLQDVVSSSHLPSVMDSCSSSTSTSTDDVNIRLQCELSLSSVQCTASCLAVLDGTTEERKNKLSELHDICEGLMHLREKLYCPMILGDEMSTTTRRTTTVIITTSDSAKWLHDLQYLESNLRDFISISSMSSMVKELCLTIPENLVTSEAILSLAGAYKLIEEGIHCSAKADAVRIGLEKGMQEDEHVEALQKELQAANATLEERNKALLSAMSQRLSLESLLAYKSSEPGVVAESQMELASLQAERDKFGSEKKQFLEAIEMLQQQNGDLETKLLQYQEESKGKGGGSSISVMIAGTDGRPTAERLNMGGQYLPSSCPSLPESTRCGDFNNSEVEDLKTALKQTKASAKTSCMSTASNLLKALPPLHISQDQLDDDNGDNVGKQRRRQKPPVLLESSCNHRRERIRRLKQLEGQVRELQSTPKVVCLGEGVQQSVDECSSRNAMALKLYAELKRARLNMKKSGGERVVFSDTTDVSNNPLVLNRRPKSTRVARLSIGSNSAQNLSSTTVTIPVVMSLSGLEQMSKSLMVPVSVPFSVPRL